MARMVSTRVSIPVITRNRTGADFVGKDGRKRGDSGRPPVLGGDRTGGSGDVWVKRFTRFCELVCAGCRLIFIKYS